ncbi:MAG: DNA repair protein RadC [Nevskiaceae bacterium]|nr:MAG: DNA repair protein RadC [Nevskiaceae bacterium]TBR72090.1 MAG: DNA repair protein RadC [Nevskiaceae bacterium]
MVRDGEGLTLTQRILRLGAESLTAVELLAVAMGATDDATLDTIRRAVTEAGSLREAMASGAGFTGAKAARLVAALELARRAAWEELTARPALTSPRESAAFLRARMNSRPYEVFSVLFLDNRHRVMAYEEMFRGTLDGASVHPREVVRSALEHNAAAVIFAHNHPSGVAEPSAADRNITRQLRDALQLIGVRVLDHLVIGSGEPTSMAARGLI